MVGVEFQGERGMGEGNKGGEVVECVKFCC